MFGVFEESLETRRRIAPSLRIAHLDEERGAVHLMRRPGPEKTGVGYALGEEAGDLPVIGYPAGLGIGVDLVDVVAQDAPSQPGVPVAEGLQIVEFAAVVARVADVEEGADHSVGNIGHLSGNRFDPVQVLVDAGGEEQIGGVQRRGGRIVDVFDGDADAFAGRLAEEVCVEVDVDLVEAGGGQIFASLHGRGWRLGHVHGEAVDIGDQSAIQVGPDRVLALDAVGVGIVIQAGKVVGQVEVTPVAQLL